MRLVISAISLILVIYTEPIDLASTSRAGAVKVHPDPILLKVFFCELEPGHLYLIGRGTMKALVDRSHQYIIGIIQGNRVCPLLAQKWYPDPRYPGEELLKYQHVKVLLDGGPVANVTEVIPDGDRLRSKFWMFPKQSRLIDVEIPSF